MFKGKYTSTCTSKSTREPAGDEGAAVAGDSYAENQRGPGAASAPVAVLNDSAAAAYFATYILLHNTLSVSAGVAARATACKE